MKDHTAVVTIREYKDGTLALAINGRDLPDLKSFDVDTVHKRVMLDIGYGVLNLLEGDADLPVPTASPDSQGFGVERGYEVELPPKVERTIERLSLARRLFRALRHR